MLELTLWVRILFFKEDSYTAPRNPHILGVTLDATMTFKNHIRSVSRAAAQRFGIMEKSWQLFHYRSLLLRSFRCFVLPVLEYCSSVLCSAADSHLKLLGRFVKGASSFLASGVSDCNLAYRRAVAVLYMLFKIKSNPMHPPSGTLLLPHVLGRATRGALVAHMQSFASMSNEYHRTFVPLSVSLWYDLHNPVFAGVGLGQSRDNAFLLA